jgi:hypothetical protein
MIMRPQSIRSTSTSSVSIAISVGVGCARCYSGASSKERREPSSEKWSESWDRGADDGNVRFDGTPDWKNVVECVLARVGSFDELVVNRDDSDDADDTDSVDC